MKCENCGENNPDQSKFCRKCGVALRSHNSLPHENSSLTHPDKFIDSQTSPYPYVISIWKLVILSIVTFGIYEIYWFYKQWKSISVENHLNHRVITLWIYSIFAPLSSYSLFKEYSIISKNTNSGRGIEAGGLAFMYFFLTRIWLGFVPLILVQKQVNLYWQNKYKDKLVRSNFGVWNWIVVVLFGTTTLFFLFSDSTTSESSTPEPQSTYNILKDYEEEIRSSVVNIYCESTVPDDYSSSGTGVILSPDGIILTNSHVIPQNEEYILVGELGCMVVLPDPVSGQVSEIFLAEPLVVPGISDIYDLAFLQINSAYTDGDTGEVMGTYPRVFPVFDDSERCSSEDIKLGEPVRIYGYPAISGGYSLTITEGIVSSFPGDGTIITSAKISNGNSGGLAVDEDGCRIGVPSMVYTDENESLGVIYSSELISEFYEEATKYLEEISKQNSQ